MTYKCGNHLIQKTLIQGLFSGFSISYNGVVLPQCQGNVTKIHTLNKALLQASVHGNQLALLIHYICIRFQDKTVDVSVSQETNII